MPQPSDQSGADTTPSTNTAARPARPRWPGVVVAAILGTAVGIAIFTFNYAEGLAYLSEDPKACINCHVMQSQYDGWLHASHGRHATCNDCHVPHDSLIAKYYVKAEHGYRHSKGFTFNDFHEPIQIKQSSRDVVAENCMRCHESVAEDTFVHTRVGKGAHGYEGVEPADCLHCHVRVGHGPKR